MSTNIQPQQGKNGQYFQQKRKGQMNQLKNLLNNVINEPDVKKGRQVIRKVIGYMTLGMDASPVFPQMCRASFTNDQVMKKMIYFYLTTYAQDNADLAIMAVNTFKKDCKHSSSKIRGLALRNLCSFKSSDYVNNVLPLIRQLLHDFQPYVKKTAIMGVLKVFYHDPVTIFNDDSIKDTLSSMIRDSDPLVSINAVLALNQILISEGGIYLTSKLVNYLLSRLKQYNQWSQTSILDIIYSYTPKSQKQYYQIMTMLWEKLKHSSISLVLASIKIIIKLAKQKQDMYKNVVQKIKAPLLTLMTGSQNTGTFEITYTILHHIDYVISQMGGKAYYEKDFKYFYCRADQPTYTKQLKIKILGKLANQYNLGDMLNQLNDYATDIDITISRKSIQILADIALNLPQVSRALIINLISLHKLEKSHIINQNMIAYYNILRKYPNLFGQVKANLFQDISLINQTQSIKCYLWIIGTFAQQISDAPYILEEYVNGENDSITGNFDQYPQQIKQVILTQTVQTFLKRAPQTYQTLIKVFKQIMQGDNVSFLLKDHAAFYYRSLRDNPQQVKKGFISINSQMGSYRQQLWGNNAQNDFNNLTIIYKKKQNKFIKNYQYFLTMRKKQLGLIQQNINDQQQQQNVLEQQQIINSNINFNQNQFDNNFTLQAQNLQNTFVLSVQEFQQTWNGLSQYLQQKYKLNPQNTSYLNQQPIEQLFKLWHLFSIASAEDQNILKFYMYCKHTNNSIACIEVQVDKQQNILSLGTKANNINFVKAVNSYICEFMMLNQFIIQGNEIVS